jgi:Fe-S cluster assembly scaffold protein SufB
MTVQTKLIDDLYNNTDTSPHVLKDPDSAHLIIHKNEVLGMQSVPGLSIDAKELEDGIKAVVSLKEGTVVKKPVHLCFGMFPETGIQKIILDINIERNAAISLLAHCVFPFAVDVKHIMDANIRLHEGAEYSYFEKHVHSAKGGVKVYPKTIVEVARKAVFKTEFELIKGRVGLIDIDVEATGDADSIIDMLARISGREDDIIKIKESAYLKGERARGVLTSKVAVRDKAIAEVYNKLVATAAYARGHVDCKEIVQDEGSANAIPIVEVRHPKAHVTHEAAIGSVDNKQLETLMSRGLSEDEAVELIISGLLSR